MWIRDALPHDLPGARILIYGYDTRLAESNNFQNLKDVALTFRASLRIALSRNPPNRPLIFIAHSLGGLVLKQALIQIASGDVVDRRIFESTYGILFFGVPNQGMDISSLLAMVGRQPNLPFLTMFSKDSGNLQGLIERFRTEFDFKDSEIISFYETCASRTARKDPEGKWSMSGEDAVLVDRYSAQSGRSWEEHYLFMQPISRNHSEMVKFSEYDEFGVIVRNTLIRFARTAPVIIRNRVNRLKSSTRSGPMDARPLANRPRSGQETKMEGTGQQSKEKKGAWDEVPEDRNKVVQGEPERLASSCPDVREYQDNLEMSDNIGSTTKVGKSHGKWHNRYLIWAARKGHVSLVQRLLDRNTKSIELVDMSRWTLLHWAAFTANLELFRLLLSRGADVHAKSKVGHSMLHLCNMDCEQKEADDYIGSPSDQKAIGLELLSRGLPVDIQDSYSRTPLMLAATCGLEDNVRMLVSKGANLRTLDGEDCPPLVRAAQNGHMGVGKAIIEGQKNDTKWSTGMSLVLAASKGMKSAVNSLLDAGVMIETTNAAGHTPLIGAVMYYHDDVVRLLLKKGANVDSRGQCGIRPIIWALDRIPRHERNRKPQLETIKLLIDGGANVHAVTGDRTSPLHRAAILGILSAVDVLLRAGADPLAKDARGLSPIDVSHDTDIRDRLVQGISWKGLVHNN